MGRKAEGTPIWESGRWKGRIPLADGTRTLVELPDCPPTASWAKAKESAGRATELERATNTILNAKRAAMASRAAAAGEPGETVKQYGARWLAARDAKGNTSVRDDRNRLGKWVYPSLGDRPIISITKDDIKALVEMLDNAVATKAIGAKTAINVWGVARKLFDDSANSKIRALCIRPANPAEGVRGPDRGVDKAKTFLYPAELVAFVCCATIPLRWRRLVAVAVYTYMRPGELEALEWEDVDLTHGTIHVHRAIDRYRGEVKATKTSVPRRLPIEPTLYPLLKAMHEESGGSGRVLDMPQVDDLAQFLRKYLKRAGVERGELFADDDTRKNIRFYDLRASGIEWRAVRNDPPMEIKRHAGHKRFSTTEIYLREADTLRQGFGDVFPVLPLSLLESPDEPSGPRGDGHLDVSGRSGGSAAATSEHVETAAFHASARSPSASIPFGSTLGSREKVQKAEPSDATSDDSRTVDVVEEALAHALIEAMKAGKWDVVAQLAKELEARRTAKAGNVVDIASRRSKR